MMSADYELIEEYRQRLIDRYTASELAEILDISTEDLVDAFETRCLGNKFLLEEVGMTHEED